MCPARCGASCRLRPLARPSVHRSHAHEPATPYNSCAAARVSDSPHDDTHCIAPHAARPSPPPFMPNSNMKDESAARHAACSIAHEKLELNSHRSNLSLQLHDCCLASQRGIARRRCSVPPLERLRLMHTPLFLFLTLDRQHDSTNVLLPHAHLRRLHPFHWPTIPLGDLPLNRVPACTRGVGRGASRQRRTSGRQQRSDTGRGRDKSLGGVRVPVTRSCSLRVRAPWARAPFGLPHERVRARTREAVREGDEAPPAHPGCAWRAR